MNDWKMIFRDGNVIAVDKPAGMLVIPGRGPEREPSLVELLEEHLGVRPFVVHRIDRETSGLVLFALDASTHRRLNLAFERRLVHKSYLAWVDGVMEGAGEIDQPLREFGSGRVAVDERGKPSRTKYRVLAHVAEGSKSPCPRPDPHEVLSSMPGTTLLEVHPVTGRRHQIRVHLYALGHPVLGDTRYGNPRPVGGAPRLMLHAWKLELADGAGLLLPNLMAEPPEGFPLPTLVP